MANEKERKSKSMTYYVLKSPGKEDLKFKKRNNTQLHTLIYNNDYPTYSIYRITVITKEELVEHNEDNRIQDSYNDEKEEVTNEKEETTMTDNKKIFEFFKKKEEPKYPKEVKQIRAGLEKLGTVSCTDEELGQAWRDFSDECYCASFLIPDDESIEHFAEWLDRNGATDDKEE